MSLRNEPSSTSTESSASRRGFLGSAAGVAAGAVLLDGLPIGAASAASSGRSVPSAAKPVPTASGLVSGIAAAVAGVTV